ncbi:MAG: hypothetical protein ACHQ1D_00135 [Nitrososphaerales archaeon]
MIGIKFNSAKTFTLIPAQTVVSDSLTIANIHDSGTSVTADLTFFTTGSNSLVVNKSMPGFIVWQGSEYISNKDWTKPQLKAAIKNILQNK